ncbi:MAG: hypothetical protein NBV76_00590 [Candidatus Ochrobactrum gambitense]|nr:MAG: hypothetical protein NBV76_00590 [Candidatus Ochrobactrum gambitense]WEK15887.1 MAG: hypothetical protein P0Y54_10385 [Candidatus Ochrobactrum gambitense]
MAYIDAVSKFLYLYNETQKLTPPPTCVTRYDTLGTVAKERIGFLKYYEGYLDIQDKLVTLKPMLWEHTESNGHVQSGDLQLTVYSLSMFRHFLVLIIYHSSRPGLVGRAEYALTNFSELYPAVKNAVVTVKDAFGEFYDGVRDSLKNLDAILERMQGLRPQVSQGDIACYNTYYNDILALKITINGCVPYHSEFNNYFDSPIQEATVIKDNFKVVRDFFSKQKYTETLNAVTNLNFAVNALTSQIDLLEASGDIQPTKPTSSSE